MIIKKKSNSGWFDSKRMKALNPIIKTTNKLIEKNTVILLAIFILLDLFAILLYWFYTQGVLESRFWRLARDRGFSEIIQYLKFGLIILMLVRWNRIRPSKLIVAWVILFVVMLIDDSLGVHEAVSELLMAVINFPEIEGYRTKDIVEAGAFAAFEGTACLYVAFCFLNKAPKDLRIYSILLALAMVPLIFSGLVLDIAHIPMMEQMGEIASMSLLLGFVHWHYRTRTLPECHWPEVDNEKKSGGN